MRKKILFVIPSFNIGGTTVSVKNIILLLSSFKYDITVMSLSQTGELSYLYNDLVKIHSPIILRAISSNSWKEPDSYILKLFYALVRFICNKSPKLKKYLLKYYANRLLKDNSYDTIISSQEGITTEFVSYSNCSNKIAWVRCDYIRYVQITNCHEEEIYAKFNSIVCVSSIMKDKFIKFFPHFIDKTFFVSNPQSAKFIIEQSKILDKDINFINDRFTIVSIGRFDPVKRFALIPSIASYLKSKGIVFRWYIIGGGNVSEYNLIQHNITEENVEDCVRCLGVKSNPYYYISNSDLFVSLSESEACPRVINEAKILHVPVVCSDFDSAIEYIINYETGIISPIEQIKFHIEEMIINHDLYNRIENNISKFSFDNSKILSTLESLL